MGSMLLKRLLGTCLLCLAVQTVASAAVSHPMDPLTADEIRAAANILLQGGAAGRDLPEHRAA